MEELAGLEARAEQALMDLTTMEKTRVKRVAQVVQELQVKQEE
jgi:hypothetical protein